MPFPKLTALLVLLCCCLHASTCPAESAKPATSEGQPPDDAVKLEKARKHFSQGVQFYNTGDYKLSLIEFRRSYELSGNHRILYNIGQVNQQLGNYANALAALEGYLREIGDEIGQERKAEVLASIVTLKTRVAHVRIVANVVAPEVLVDGFPVRIDNAHGEIALDPGDHRIDLRKPGYQSGGTVVTLAAGDANRVRVDLVRVPRSVRTTLSTYTQPPRRDSTWLWIGWTTTAATALGAGITGVLAVTQANELANLRNSPGTTQAQRDEVGGRAKAFAISSDVLTIAALATGVASVYLTFRSDKTTERAPSSNTRVALTLGGLAIEKSF